MGSDRFRFFANLPAGAPIQPPHVPRKSFVKTNLPLSLTRSGFCRESTTEVLYFDDLARTGGGGHPPSHSHSIVPGGFEVTSYTTRLMPFTSLTMRLEMVFSTSCGRSTQSAVMPSSEFTARMAQV